MADPKLLDLNDRDFVTDYLRRYPPTISEHTFTNLLVWRNMRPIWFFTAAESLVFLAPSSSGAGRDVFGPVAGPLPLRDAIAAAGPDVHGAVRISENATAQLPGNAFDLLPDEDDADYVYLVSDLAELHGERYHKKRNLIQQCLESYPCRYEELTPALVPECAEMQRRWCQTRNCDVDPGLCHEAVAVATLFRHYQELNLIGGVIRIGGVVQAFAVGEALSPGTAVCHFEKAMPDFHGLSQVINCWFAKFALAGFEFVNREQDLGVPGLRQAKQSYHPHHMVRKFTVRPAPVA
jgi:uncharacterized protein